MNEIETLIRKIDGDLDYIDKFGRKKDAKKKKELELLRQAMQEKLERDNPQPLGLEELKLMHRQPVYIITEDKKYWGICIVDNTRKGRYVSFSATGSNYGVQQDEYGKTWLAYRHKPEHIGEAANMVEGE